MEDDLLGYVLHALDAESERRVEAYLHDHPEAQATVQSWQQTLEMLSADTEQAEPPRDLVGRTIARVAEYRCRPLPYAPAESLGRYAGRGWWRRADVLVAASILLCAALLTFPALNMIRFRHDRLACENNLREIGLALRQYADQPHQGGEGRFPDIVHAFDRQVMRVDGHRIAAGLFAPMLVQAGNLTTDRLATLRCPGRGEGAAEPFVDLDALAGMPATEFRARAAALVPAYAYTLGYSDGGEIHGLSRSDGVLPIAADCPALSPDGLPIGGNSLNHGGRGQNVLFTDGHVEWNAGRFVDNDDFFINQANELAAGLHARDYVLGPSGAQP